MLAIAAVTNDADGRVQIGSDDEYGARPFSWK